VGFSFPHHSNAQSNCVVSTARKELAMTVDNERVVHLILRRINRQTLRLAIPSAYWKDHGLDAGDHVVWIPDADGVRLKFVKTRKLAEANAHAE
jgi:hypothetical protein